MFWIDVVRACGHKEKVLVEEGLDPKKSLPKALDELERGLASQPCTKCVSITKTAVEAPKPKMDAKAAFTLLVVIVALLSVIITSYLVVPVYRALRISAMPVSDIPAAIEERRLRDARTGVLPNEGR